MAQLSENMIEPLVLELCTGCVFRKMLYVIENPARHRPQYLQKVTFEDCAPGNPECEHFEEVPEDELVLDGVSDEEMFLSGRNRGKVPFTEDDVPAPTSRPINIKTDKKLINKFINGSSDSDSESSSSNDSSSSPRSKKAVKKPAGKPKKR